MVHKVALNIIKDLILTIILISILSVFIYKYWPENTSNTTLNELIKEALPLIKISDNKYILKFNKSSISRIDNYSRMDRFSGIDNVFDYFYKIYVSVIITQIVHDNFPKIDSFKIRHLRSIKIYKQNTIYQISRYIVANSNSIDFDSLIFNIYVNDGKNWENILDVIQEFRVTLTQNEINALISYLKDIDPKVKEEIIDRLKFKSQKPRFRIIWNRTIGNLGVLWRYMLYSLILLIIAIIIPYKLVKFVLINSLPGFFIYLLFFPPFFISVITMEIFGIGYIPSLIAAIIGNGLTFVLYQYSSSIHDRENRAPYFLALKELKLKKKFLNRALDFHLSPVILKRISSLLDTLIIIGVIVGRGDTPLITKVLFSMSRSNNIESMIWMLTFIIAVNLIMFFLRSISYIWTEGIREEVF